MPPRKDRKKKFIQDESFDSEVDQPPVKKTTKDAKQKSKTKKKVVKVLVQAEPEAAESDDIQEDILNVSNVKTVDSNTDKGKTLDGKDRLRAASYPFTDEEQVELLNWFKDNEMGKGKPAYQLTKYTTQYDDLATNYVNCGGNQIFNYFKSQKRKYTTYKNTTSKSGAAATELSDLEPLLQKTIEVFSSDGRRVTTKNRVGLKTKMVSK